MSTTNIPSIYIIMRENDKIVDHQADVLQRITHSETYAERGWEE